MAHAKYHKAVKAPKVRATRPHLKAPVPKSYGAAGANVKESRLGSDKNKRGSGTSH